VHGLAHVVVVSAPVSGGCGEPVVGAVVVGAVVLGAVVVGAVFELGGDVELVFGAFVADGGTPSGSDVSVVVAVGVTDDGALESGAVGVPAGPVSVGTLDVDGAGELSASCRHS
jgi:hypothetical protein